MYGQATMTVFGISLLTFYQPVAQSLQGLRQQPFYCRCWETHSTQPWAVTLLGQGEPYYAVRLQIGVVSRAVAAFPKGLNACFCFCWLQKNRRLSFRTSVQDVLFVISIRMEGLSSKRISLIIAYSLNLAGRLITIVLFVIISQFFFSMQSSSYLISRAMKHRKRQICIVDCLISILWVKKKTKYF